jgi:osmotically-inducible protein OsmY
MMRKRLGILVLLAAAPLLQSCFPLAVTGVAAGALVASDRRTTGMYIEDDTIELKALGRLHDFPTAHVNATSYNRRVLLTGEVYDEKVKKQVFEAVHGIDNVREVIDETQIAGASSLASRGNDALITSNVKARMLNNNGRFSANHIKVVTEAGVVYLMGLVRHSEGDAAAEIARNTSGVNRVVKVFEYID